MAAKNLAYWVNKLTNQNMPVVGKVMAELNSLTGSDESDASQLAEVILRDPNLTSHVLRVANSVHYNYSNTPINTISRAIVLIGFKGMRAVCISLLMIDSLLSEGPKERLLQLIAQGLHAATQARDLIKMHDEDASEEVFIAALLFNLGEMAFLANETISDKDPDLIDPDAKIRKEAMERFLGTSFKAITRALAKSWSLSETLEQALSARAPSRAVQAVILGERMSRASLKGWDSGAVTKVVSEIAAFSKLKPEQCFEMAQESAERAADVALQYGVADACILIPGKDVTISSIGSAYNTQAHKIMRGDPQLQLNILRELTTATAERTDVNTIFQMVVEGMHRGIGLERVAIAFLSRHNAKAKYVLGEGTELWRETFDFDSGPYSDNIFTHAIEKGGASWIDQAIVDDKKGIITADIAKVLGRRQSFLFVLKVGARVPALFYADRGDFGGKLSEEQYDGFRHFAEQAQLSLNILSKEVVKPKTAYR